MKLKNYQIKELIELLHSLPLKGKKSRMRTKFLKELLNHYHEYFLVEVEKLKKDYVTLNDKGKIEYIDDKYFEEERCLFLEEYVFDLNESNKMLLLSIAEIMLEGDFELKDDVATFYDEWCEQFEEIIEYYNERESD